MRSHGVLLQTGGLFALGLALDCNITVKAGSMLMATFLEDDPAWALAIGSYDFARMIIRTVGQRVPSCAEQIYLG